MVRCGNIRWGNYPESSKKFKLQKCVARSDYTITKNYFFHIYETWKKNYVLTKEHKTFSYENRPHYSCVCIFTELLEIIESKTYLYFKSPQVIPTRKTVVFHRRLPQH